MDKERSEKLKGALEKIWKAEKYADSLNAALLYLSCEDISITVSCGVDHNCHYLPGALVDICRPYLLKQVLAEKERLEEELAGLVKV